MKLFLILKNTELAVVLHRFISGDELYEDGVYPVLGNLKHILHLYKANCPTLLGHV